MFSWQRQFTDVYTDCRRFSFVFHSELSHDNSTRLPLADRDFLQHLTTLHTSGHLNRALLVLMSDHGARFDDTRRTKQGKYEERLPFLAVRLPPYFTDRYPDAAAVFRTNAATERLVTPFDVHATIRHVTRRRFTAEPETDDDDDDAGRQGVAGKLQGGRRRRGMSLFQDIPASRTCAEADIAAHWCAFPPVSTCHCLPAAHWCACLQWLPVSVDDTRVRQVSLRLVDVINDVTSSRRELCAALSLDDVTNADSFAPDARLLHFRRSADIDGRIPEMMTSHSE